VFLGICAHCDKPQLRGMCRVRYRASLRRIGVIILAEAAPLHLLGKCLQAIRRVPGVRPVSGMIIRILAQFGGELLTLPGRHTGRVAWYPRRVCDPPHSLPELEQSLRHLRGIGEPLHWHVWCSTPLSTQQRASV
jgi:hypothetical protein